MDDAGYIIGFVSKCASLGLNEEQTAAVYELSKQSNFGSVIGTGIMGAGLGAGAGMLHRKMSGPFEEGKANKDLEQLSAGLSPEDKEMLVRAMSQAPGHTPYSYGDAALRGATVGGLGGAASNLLSSGLLGT